MVMKPRTASGDTGGFLGGFCSQPRRGRRPLSDPPRLAPSNQEPPALIVPACGGASPARGDQVILCQVCLSPCPGRVASGALGTPVFCITGSGWAPYSHLAHSLEFPAPLGVRTGQRVWGIEDAAWGGCAVWSGCWGGGSSKGRLLLQGRRMD